MMPAWGPLRRLLLYVAPEVREIAACPHKLREERFEPRVVQKETADFLIVVVIAIRTSFTGGDKRVLQHLRLFQRVAGYAKRNIGHGWFYTTHSLLNKRTHDGDGGRIQSRL